MLVRPAEEAPGVEAEMVGVGRSGGSPRRCLGGTRLLFSAPGHHLAVSATERVDAGQTVAEDDRLTFHQLWTQFGRRQTVRRAADANTGAKLDHGGGTLPVQKLGRRTEVKWRSTDGVDEVWNGAVRQQEPDGGIVALNGGQK